MEELGAIKGSVDCIYFIQDLTVPHLVEKTIRVMLIALGDSVAEASVIIATKGNKFNMQDDD